MSYVMKVLDEFDGKLSYDEIVHKTYKEIGYLRDAKRELDKSKHPAGKDIEKIMKQ